MRVLDVSVMRRLLEWPMTPMRKVIVLAREHEEHALADALTVARDAWARAAADWLTRQETKVVPREDAA